MGHDFDAISDIKKIADSCYKMQIKSFKKDEIVTTYLAKRNQICIVLEGVVDLIRYDSNGNKTIVERFKQNDLFGEVFHTVNTNNELFVVAKEDVQIVQFIYDDLQKKCDKKWKFHEALYANLLELILTKIIHQNIRIELLTKHTIREKILYYFSFLSSKHFSKTFTIPFSFTDLAYYLNADRSALMRELKHLEDEGFIKRNGKKISLLF